MTGTKFIARNWILFKILMVNIRGESSFLYGLIFSTAFIRNTMIVLNLARCYNRWSIKMEK